MWRAPVQMASSEYCGRVFHRILVVDLVLEFALHVVDRVVEQVIGVAVRGVGDVLSGDRVARRQAL